MIHRLAPHLDRIRQLFAPRKPRHPLARFGLGLAGLLLVVMLVFAGVFLGAAMLIGGAMYRLWTLRGKPRAATQPQRTLQGEYRVVRRSTLPHHHAH